MPDNLLVVDALAVALAMLARREIAAAFETIFAVRHKAGRVPVRCNAQTLERHCLQEDARSLPPKKNWRRRLQQKRPT
jgi:hypothetical protein